MSSLFVGSYKTETNKKTTIIYIPDSKIKTDKIVLDKIKPNPLIKIGENKRKNLKNIFPL